MALLDPITNAPKNQKVALGAMACVVVAALGYFLLLSPKQTERDALRQQSEQVRGELAQAQALEASLRGFRAQAEALRKSKTIHATSAAAFPDNPLHVCSIISPKIFYFSSMSRIKQSLK